MKNMGGFSATMGNVLARFIYVMVIMIVEITAMSPGQMELFVVYVLDLFCFS